ncbi:MAG: hypothetical protein WEG40_14445 [Candidatus Rokuibacteriota bacterium]
MAVAFVTGATGALIYLNLLRVSPDAALSINWTAYTISPCAPLTPALSPLGRGLG